MKGWVVCFVLGMILFSQASYGLEGDTIYLHDGSSIIGKIIESIPKVSFTLKRPDGSIRVFKMEEVWKVKFEEEEISENRLYLKDGGVIIGRIIGAIPNETYRIRLIDKSVLIFKMDEVSRVEFKVAISPPIAPSTPKIEPQPQLVAPPVAPKKGGLKIGLCLNYPGGGLKISPSPNFLLEARGQFGKDINVWGGRLQHYFNPKGKIYYFAGIEGDLVSFKGEVSKGNGYAIALFLGGEYFLSNALSFQLDFGPVYVSIKDKATNLSESGADYLVNLGLNLYILGK
jgi:hypothetical protein